jgi:hypothetical protein
MIRMHSEYEEWAISNIKSTMSVFISVKEHWRERKKELIMWVKNVCIEYINKV